MAGGWRIRHKLMLGMGLVSAIMALLLAGTFKGLASYQSTRRTIDSKLTELEWAEKLREATKVLADPCSERPSLQAGELLDKVSAAQKALLDYAMQLDITVNLGRDPDRGFHEKQLIQAIRKQLEKLERDLRDRKNVVIRSGAVDLDLTHKGTPIRQAIDQLVQTSMDLITSINDDLRLKLKSAKRDYTISMAIVLSTSIVAVLLMAGLSRFFYRWVFYPIRDLEAGVGQVAKGDFEHRIEVRSGDEIEDLAKAYNDMTGRLRDMYRDLAQQVNERSRQLVRSERLAGVGFLAAGVAHEINNPLAGIAFCSEALKRRLADLFVPANFQAQAVGSIQQEREIFTKYLNMIEEEAFRCKNITQKLLAFSRGSEKRRERTVMGDLVQSVLDMVQHHENCKGKELIFQPTQTIEAWVNSQEVKQVLLNLVMNALDSMDEGGRLVITQTLRNDMVELVFQDTGCGMTTEVLDNIFEPFFTRSRSGKGTGLGLSISHQIITQHGGDIEASSAGPGQGSTFIVRLPIKPPQEETSGNDEEQLEAPEVEFKKFAQKRARRAA